MSILRVGPWGNLDEWYKPEPFDTTIDSIYYPINCALENWNDLTNTWACFAITDSGFIDEDPDYTYSKVGLGEEVSKSSNAALLRFTPTVSFNFCYQATDEFNVNFNWAFTGNSFENFPSLSWSYTTIDGDTGSYFNTPADSGTEIIVLKPTTLGIVNASVSAYDFNFTTITTTASLSKPAF